MKWPSSNRIGVSENGSSLANYTKLLPTLDDRLMHKLTQHAFMPLDLSVP